MNITDAIEDILKYLNSRNEILKLEAEVALIKLHEQNPIEIFERIQGKITEWGQMNFQKQLTEKLDYDLLKKLLENKNESVVLFAVRMFGLLKKVDSISDLSKFLDHSNPEIRGAAITSLGKIEIPEVIEMLINVFDKEVTTNQLNIINILATVVDNNILNFFDKIVLGNYDNIVKLLVTRTLIRLGERRRLDKIYSQADEDLKNIINLTKKV